MTPYPLAQNQYMQEKVLGELIFVRIHAGPVFAQQDTKDYLNQRGTKIGVFPGVKRGDKGGGEEGRMVGE